MSRKLLALLLFLALVPGPVRADDDDRDESKDKDKKESVEKDKKVSKSDDKDDDKDKDKAKSKKASPIKKLIELKLDPFLVASRGLNIPSFGRSQEVRDLLQRFEKWGKDDDVGAILLNLDGLNLAIPDIEELRSSVAEFRKTGKLRGVGALFVNGNRVGEATVAPTVGVSFAPLGLSIGSSRASSVTPEYEPPFRFQGSIDRVVFELGDDRGDVAQPSYMSD